MGLTNSSSGLAIQLREQSTEQLIKEYEALDQAINQVGCFSPEDVVRFYAIEAELAGRGCKFVTETKVIPPEKKEDRDERFREDRDEGFREGLEFVARIQLGGDSAEKEET